MDRLLHGFVPSGHGLALLVGTGPRGDDLGAQGPPPPLLYADHIHGRRES